jgi:ATP-dependent DNA helicase RecG
MNHSLTISEKKLSALLAQGEGESIEFKRSTGEMKEAMQTLCAFLNGIGGTVLFGIRPDGTAEGQDVTDKTLREIAQAADRFEPPAHVSIHRVKAKAGREVVAVAVEGGRDMRPFAHEGHAYERVSSTTRRMPQAKYERLLVERGHARRRWENLPADGLALKDLDRKEILRTRELAIQQNRISPDTNRDIGEILDRLGLRVAGVLTQAALVLYGKRFLPDYPQCLLKMGRFRGTEITGEIVDNRQEHMNAFAMVREGMAFLERTMPLGARFPEGQIFREDRFPVPPDALREILLNAVMHRDYSHYSGHVAIVVFDDRIEIRSYGRLPNGVTVKQLSGKHISKPTNPLIAGAFHRTGAVEVWGRGTNRVIEMCKKHGAAPPTFEEMQGFLIVTFKAQLVAGGMARVGSQVESKVESRVESVGGLEDRIAAVVKLGPLSKSEIAIAVGKQKVDGQLHSAVRQMLQKGLIEYTLPDKANSRLQKYRLTEKGRQVLSERPGGGR